MIEAFFRNIENGKILFRRFRTVCCLSARHDSGVYLCQDIEQGNREVALKIVSSELTKDSDSLDRFRNELQVSNRIMHPNVLNGEEFFEDDSFAAFSMDYAPGGTLSQVLGQKEPVSLERALDILIELAEALEAIHEAGILHRDLKPENILFDSRGKVKIADFGIALLGSSVKTSKDQALFGTVNYLSPEYIQTGRFDQRSDIYSLGLIAYELITGRMPYQGTAPLRILLDRVQQDPPEPNQFAPRMPQALNDLIMKAIARNPNRRYQSSGEVLEDLRKLRNEILSGTSGKTLTDTGDVEPVGTTGNEPEYHELIAC